MAVINYSLVPIFSTRHNVKLKLGGWFISIPFFLFYTRSLNIPRGIGSDHKAILLKQVNLFTENGFQCQALAYGIYERPQKV